MDEREQRSHAEFEELLSAFLDGELSPEERRLVEEHLATCPSCRHLLGQLGTTHQVVARLHQAEAPADFLGKVQRRIALRSRGRYYRTTIHRKRATSDVVILTMILVLLGLLVIALVQGVASFYLIAFPEPGGTEAPLPATAWEGPPAGGYRVVVEPGVERARLQEVLVGLARAHGSPPPPPGSRTVRLQLPAREAVPFLRELVALVPVHVEREQGAPPPVDELAPVRIEVELSGEEE